MTLEQQQAADDSGEKGPGRRNGCGAIGKRVADAEALAHEPERFHLYGANGDDAGAMRNAGLDVAGNLDDLLAASDPVVDCTPKKIAAENVASYRQRGIKLIVQGGEKHEVTGHCFVAEATMPAG